MSSKSRQPSAKSAGRKKTTGLSRAAILGAKDLELTPVPVPEWGGSVFVRSMSGKERLAWEAEIRETVVAAKGTEDVSDGELGAAMASQGVQYDLVVRTVCDEDGDLLFTADDIPALEEKSWTALERVIRAAALASGIPLGDEPSPLADDLGNSSSGTGSKSPGSA